MLSITLLLAASVVVGQTEIKVPENVRDQMQFLVGNWKIDGEFGDESYKATYSAKWLPGEYCLLLSYHTEDLVGTAISGWDPITEEIIETWYSPTVGRMEIRYKLVTDTVWEGVSVSHDTDGTTVKGTVRLEKHGKSQFTYTQKTDGGIRVQKNRKVIKP